MKQLLTTLVVFSISVSLLIACGDKTASSEETKTADEAKPTFDLAAAKQAIDSTNALFGTLVSKSDSVAIAALYASDAKLMGYNMPAASGRSAIQSAFGAMLSGVGGVKLTTTEVWGADPLVAEEGTFTLMGKDGKEIDKGKYIVLWKMEDGKWKLFRDCFNSDLPPAAPPK